MAFCTVLAGVGAPGAEPLVLKAHPAASADYKILIDSSFLPGQTFALERSTNLANWWSLAVLHDGIRSYPDFGSASKSASYYRASARPRLSGDDWKNQIVCPDDPFRNEDTPDGVHWLKFSIPLSDPVRVYYQDSAAFLFHYNFCTRRLPQFSGLDYAAFDAVSLYRANRQVVLGAVLFPPTGSFVEYGVQFIGRDSFTPAEIAGWLNLVRATVYATNGAGVFYVPTYEQAEEVRTNKPAFDALGVRIASLDRWVPGDHCYAPGWALGRLVYFPGAEIASAWSGGQLLPGDILLTDGVPADTPAVAGIIALRPSTPNSHTAILARSFGIPFVHFPAAEVQSWLLSLSGRTVFLRAETSSYAQPKVAVFDLHGAMDPVTRDQILSLKKPAPIRYSPKQSFGSFSASTDPLTPADIRFFGGKAANYGFLRRQVPDRCPPAVAFSFDLWDAFMDQLLPGTGTTLREEIGTRLAPHTNYPPDIPALQTALTGIRALIRQTASFNPAQREAIVAALAGFDPGRKIRFRSSTNVEDAEQFTGAGLYDSYSGCLLDDLDGDTSGPCQCDPLEPAERGVLRALQRVYASFYNDNAYLERLRHAVQESEVGMAVLVHHSFPDEDELANGVATLDWRYSPGYKQFSGEMVTQKGAVSVTNPDGSSVPEVVSVQGWNSYTGLTLTRYSSLLPAGAHVMAWQGDYDEFMGYFGSVAQAYRDFYPAKTTFTLDFEYKKDRNLGLVVKQVREIPPPAAAGSSLAYLADQPGRLVVAQKEAGDVFSNHRLKSVLDLATINAWLASSNLTAGIYITGRVEYAQAGFTAVLDGPLAGWPESLATPDGKTNRWATGPAENPRVWQLETALTAQSPSTRGPVVVQNDFNRWLRVFYAKPVPTITWQGETNTSAEFAVLSAPLPVTPGCILVRRTFATNGITVATSFYWPKPDGGIVAGYTAPLVQFVETRITGLTSSAIVLTNYFSQTYRPGHHNFTEEFIFEPRLEPGLAPATRAELESANIQLLYLQVGFQDGLKILGLDQKFRKP